MADSASLLPSGSIGREEEEDSSSIELLGSGTEELIGREEELLPSPSRELQAVTDNTSATAKAKVAKRFIKLSSVIQSPEFGGFPLLSAYSKSGGKSRWNCKFCSNPSLSPLVCAKKGSPSLHLFDNRRNLMPAANPAGFGIE
jgi:hypothetical protein